MSRNPRTFAAAAAAAAVALMAGAPLTHAQPAPPPAAEAPVDPQQLALAKHLMSLTLGQMNFGAIMRSMTASMMDALHRQNPNMDPVVLQHVQTAMDKAVSDITPELMDDIARSYARHLNRKEMEDSIAFYESPSGQSILHKMPEVLQDLGPMMVKYVPRMQRAVIDSLCAQNACTPAQREAMEHPPAAGAPAR